MSCPQRVAAGGGWMRPAVRGRPEPPRVWELPDGAVLDPREAAAWLKVHPRQLVRLGVPAVVLGPRTRRYEVGQVRAWLAAHRQGVA